MVGSSPIRYGRQELMIFLSSSWWFSRNRADNGVSASKGGSAVAPAALFSLLLGGLGRDCGYWLWMVLTYCAPGAT